MAKSNLIAEPGKHEMIYTRVFDSSPAQVYRAYTNPELVSKWWGPRSVTTTVDKMDVQFGGVWRYLQKGDDGETAFRGVYHVVEEGTKLVFTFEWEGMPGHVLLETLTFEDQHGKTLLTDRSVFQTVEDRDGMLQYGAEGGMNESMERLEEVLAQVA
jgi:uncharacterized protein YndB with AHSA1/START domain